MSPEPTAGDREREALLHYAAALTAALEMLRHAQERFERVSLAIDGHARNARAAAADAC